MGLCPLCCSTQPTTTRFVTLLNNFLPEIKPLKMLQNQGIDLRVRRFALGMSQKLAQDPAGNGNNYYNP